MIGYEDFKKVEMRVGKIISAEAVEKSEKLLLLSVDFGLKESIETTEEAPLEPEKDIRTVVSGIAKYFSPEELPETVCVFVTNLEPRPIMGYESQAMILGVVNGDSFAIFKPSADVPVGSLLG